MDIGKRLAATGAIVGLAAAGLVGITGTAAQASARNCQILATRFQSQLNVCGERWSAGVVYATYTLERAGSTDERVWFKAETGCGELYSSDNDFSNPVGVNGYGTVISCANGAPVYSVEVYTTESGSPSSNGVYVA
ncbi:hypothetical protein ACFW1A_10500 [Kitasatospora sp. NPDC058965]|uniref:hypothetical protein n=1 Tax=Kitasatospora sp. NPDC058965 TaxID=3346682 RepID=UPI003677F01E